MNIAFIYMPFAPDMASFGVHGHYLAKGLIAKGHRLLIPGHGGGEGVMPVPPGKWAKIRMARMADLLYIRVGIMDRRERLTLLRCIRPSLPVVWEVNAPAEELLAWENGTEERHTIARDRRRK